MPDLAEDIGSPRWLRGLATMVGLCACALAFWPDFSVRPVPGVQALSGDSGRRMNPAAAALPVAAMPDPLKLESEATLGQGDSLGRLLERVGADPVDAARAAQLVDAALRPDELAPDPRVKVELGARGARGTRPIVRLVLRARFDLDLEVSRPSGVLALTAHPLAVDATPLRIRGIIGTGIYRSARAAGAPIEAIQQYLQVLDQHLSLDTAIEPGDAFDIIVAYKRSANGDAQVGELLFAGLEHAGRPKAQLLRWGPQGQFFEAAGMGAQRTGLIMPVVGRITSSFGLRRHPILGFTRLHAGVDFGAAYGAPIYAVGDGIVTYAGWHGGHGNYVRVDHGGGYGTGYGHMSRIAVTDGTRVRAGQVIGYVGSTGLSTGPHLHYELYQGGAPVNPLAVRFTVSNQVDAAELAAFRARMAQLKTLRPGAALASLAPLRTGFGAAL